jgi:hypothetical protein
MKSYIAQISSTKQGIAEGVYKYIGIRMTQQTY